MTTEQLNELRRLCDAWLRGREATPGCELVNEERMAWLASGMMYDLAALVVDARRLTDEIDKLNPACTSIGPGMLQTIIELSRRVAAHVKES